VLTTTDDLRVTELKELSTPEEVIREIPRTLTATRTVSAARNAIHDVLTGKDDRLIVVVGPCSIHDPAAAVDYASRLAALRDSLSDRLEIVMRVYFEKPRTTVGWKGLINDPDIDGSFNIDKGLRLARTVLAAVNNLGLPAATEFLDMTTPQYIADLVSWGAIGARTTESQIHRELASGLSCPVGFKNGTDGNLRIAVDAVKSAAQPHHFMAVTKAGRSAIAASWISARLVPVTSKLRVSAGRMRPITRTAPSSILGRCRPVRAARVRRRRRRRARRSTTARLRRRATLHRG